MTTCLSNPPAIVLEDVSKQYPFNLAGRGGAAFFALDHLTCAVNSADVTGIIGRNGAGKTTLLSVMAGVLSPSAGRVAVRGKALGLFSLGCGFQDELSGRENIFLNAALFGASRQIVLQRLPAIIAFSELGDFIDMPLGSYSQGMRLRLGFSIVTHLDFDTLLIDEVLSVGDTVFQNKCLQRLIDLKREGKTLVISTQDLALIERLCDRVLLLDHGKLLCDGLPAEAVGHYRRLQAEEVFFVGPSRKPHAAMVTQTKKWAEDMQQWGARLGTKEVVIEQVRLSGRFGLPCAQIFSGDPLTVRMGYRVRDEVKAAHFGVAIFRRDGVYCYGTNTSNDGVSPPVLGKGSGVCSLTFTSVQLSPGSYVLSVAVWDKDEKLAYDYHNGCYELTIRGNVESPAPLAAQALALDVADISLSPMQRLALSRFVDSCAYSPVNDRGNDPVLETGQPAVIGVPLDSSACPSRTVLWAGVFRSDGVYCCGSCGFLGRRRQVAMRFKRVPFLPGRYLIRCGIWDAAAGVFRASQQPAGGFAAVYDRADHGTVLLDHTWRI